MPPASASGSLQERIDTPSIGNRLIFICSVRLRSLKAS
jgi:hypothetical protein